MSYTGLVFPAMLSLVPCPAWEHQVVESALEAGKNLFKMVSNWFPTGRMLKGLVLNIPVLRISVFQDRPTRGHIICSKKVLKNVSTKKVQNDIGPKHVKVQTFIYCLLFRSQFLYFDMGLINVQFKNQQMCLII